MTDRDKLIELLCKVECEGEESFLNCPKRRNGNCQSIMKLEMCQVNAIADYLLANGVIVPQRKKDEHKIQIGDVLYEYSYTYGKVHEWKVLDIWLENYIGGNKTIVKCSNGTWTKEFFVADVLQFHKTKEEAEKALEERTGNNG